MAWSMYIELVHFPVLRKAMSEHTCLPLRDTMKPTGISLCRGEAKEELQLVERRTPQLVKQLLQRGNKK